MAYDNPTSRLHHVIDLLLLGDARYDQVLVPSFEAALADGADIHQKVDGVNALCRLLALHPSAPVNEDRGASANDNGVFPNQDALVSCFIRLVEGGAQPLSPDNPLWTAGPDRLSAGLALMKSVEEHGVVVRDGHGQTPLHALLRYVDKSRIPSVLCRYWNPQHVSVQDDQGNTVLHALWSNVRFVRADRNNLAWLAHLSNLAAITRLLVKAGAPLDKLNNDRISPIEQIMMHPDVIDLAPSPSNHSVYAYLGRLAPEALASAQQQRLEGETSPAPHSSGRKARL